MGNLELTEVILMAASDYVAEAIMDIYGNDISNAINGMTANKDVLSSLVVQRIILNIKQDKLGY